MSASLLPGISEADASKNATASSTPYNQARRRTAPQAENGTRTRVCTTSALGSNIIASGNHDLGRGLALSNKGRNYPRRGD